MLEIAYGATTHPVQVRHLVESLQQLELHGTLYVGYPVFRTADERITADALLTAQECGVVLFDLSTPAPSVPTEPWLSALEERQSDFYRSLFNKLLANKELTRGRGLAFDIHVVTLVPAPPEIAAEYADVEISTPESLPRLLGSYGKIDDELFRRINAAVQRTRNIRPANKRDYVRQPDSRGAILRRIEAEIANLDAWQKKAALEFPDAPQRIRGLAGSGKTIVLGLKAAYLHATHPDWRIAVTFQTRSLYQQFEDLIRRFSYDTIGDEPDWTKLRIMHAWGGRGEAAIYYEIATAHGVEPKDFLTAKKLYGGEAFAGVCREVLQAGASGGFHQIYDAVLIDEAQDFPAAFFELIYQCVVEPKRIVYAYDELQNLGEYSMAPASELFGSDEHGGPRVQLRNRENQPEQDIVLPVCYRNTPWSLTIAHGVGFGVAREAGLVQMFDEVSLWTEIGYEVADGRLALGSHVTLARKPDCSPAYFAELLNPDDAVVLHAFDSEEAQATEISRLVRRAIDDEELEARDILIILPDAYTAKSKAPTIMKALDRVGLASHLAGVTSSRDVLFINDSVAITQIYRAKGNEAALVFVANADYCYEGAELSRKRNTLFTAITRSKAWVRVFGVGARMRSLMEEVDRIRGNRFRLEFDYPTQQEIDRLRRIHRDLDPGERQRLDQQLTAALSLVDQIEAGSLAVESLPSELRERLGKLLK